MITLYFIINTKEHVCIMAENKSLAKDAFHKLSLSKTYQSISDTQPSLPSKLIETIKQQYV